MAVVSLGGRDLRMVLGAAGALTEPDAPSDMVGLLELVGTLVRSDGVSWSRLDVTRRRVLAGTTTISDPTGDTLLPAFWAHYHEHPLCHGRGGAMVVAGLGDVLSKRELHRTSLYHDYLRPLGAEHLMKVDLGHPPGQTNVFLLQRAGGRDFDDRDHLVLALLRPHLAAATRRLTSPIPKLTPREREVLTLVRQGLTNRSVARSLRVSPHTVRKHLENAYTRLGVQSRTAAVTAFAEGSPDLPSS
jgi:DNA-binding CsgD family transcriptional regulator